MLNELAIDFKNNKNMCYCYKIAAQIGAVGIPRLSMGTGNVTLVGKTT